MNRFAAACSTASPTSPRRNAKIRLLADYFRDDAGPGPRLCARGDDRRAVVPQRQARR